MFAMSRSDLAPAYTCGTYHRRGLKGCTSHHIRVETLDALVKDYVRKVRDNSSAMLERLNADLEKEQTDIAETKRTEENLEALLLDKQEELKATKRQRIRDIMKHPEQEALLDETYDELEAELTQRIAGIQHQIEFASDKRNTIIRINRLAKTAIDVFNDILEKPALDRNDLNLMIEKIQVYEDHIEVQLKADIDSLLKTGALPEDAANFKSRHGKYRNTRGSMWASIPTKLKLSKVRRTERTRFSVSVLSAAATRWRSIRRRTAR